MDMNSIFKKDQGISLDNAKRAKDYLYQPFTIRHAKTIYSDKHQDYFVAIETNEGDVFTTWSQVVVQKIEKMLSLSPEQWSTITVQFEEIQSQQSRFKYLDLVAV